MIRLTSSIFLAALLASCVGQRALQNGQPCPCAPGWACDATTSTCVRSDIDAASEDGNFSDDSNGGAGSPANCTGDYDGPILVMSQCATSGCHDTVDAYTSGGGLDLTVNSGIASRLVGVQSSGDTSAGSVCAGNTEPYLISGSNPATGLLIQKIQPRPSCGTPMPYPGVALLTTQQQNCIIRWATTLTSP